MRRIVQPITISVNGLLMGLDPLYIGVQSPQERCLDGCLFFPIGQSLMSHFPHTYRRSNLIVDFAFNFQILPVIMKTRMSLDLGAYLLFLFLFHCIQIIACSLQTSRQVPVSNCLNHLFDSYAVAQSIDKVKSIMCLLVDWICVDFS